MESSVFGSRCPDMSCWDIAEVFTWYQHNRWVHCCSLLILLDKTPLALLCAYNVFVFLPPCRTQSSREAARDPELPDVCEDEVAS